MKTNKFARKTFYVDAVRVSEANIEEVAKWCKGTIEQDAAGHTYINVEVHRPLTERQGQAYISDWVLASGSGYKVYTPKAFTKSFEKVKTLTKEQADAAGITVPHEPRPKNEKPRPVPTAPKKAPRVGTVGEALIGAQEKLDQGALAKATRVGSGVEEVVAATSQDGVKTAPVSAEHGVMVVEFSGKTKADVEAEALIAEVKSLSES